MVRVPATFVLPARNRGEEVNLAVGPHGLEQGVIHDVAVDRDGHAAPQGFAELRKARLQSTEELPYVTRVDFDPFDSTSLRL